MALGKFDEDPKPLSISWNHWSNVHCLSFVFILYFDHGLEDFIIEQAIVNNFAWNKNILKDIGFNEQHYVFVLYMSFKYKCKIIYTKEKCEWVVRFWLF